VQYDIIHINSEFADQVSDHDRQVVRIRPLGKVPVQVPETPVAILLPLAGLGVVGFGVRSRRRRVAYAA